MVPKIIHKHEDDRRTLIEWHTGAPMKRCKIIEVKGKVKLGNHYHLKSDSVFYIFKGKASYTLREMRSKGLVRKGWLFEGESLSVPRNFVHTFEAYPDTILLEAASEPYDKEDEIQVTE